MSELIKISKEFKGAMGGVWLGKEIEIPDGADDVAEFIKQNEILERAWMAMNPQINWSESSRKENSDTTPIPINEKIEGMKSIIKLGHTKTFLEKQKAKVEELNDPSLTEAYNNKLKSFE